jgi:putative endonuclease
MSYWVYILTNKNHTTPYIGVTNNPLRRLDEHKRGKASSFTKKYNLYKLVYLEEATNPYDAISREKQLKGWRRSRKEELINSVNPGWDEVRLST